MGLAALEGYGHHVEHAFKVSIGQSLGAFQILSGRLGDWAVTREYLSYLDVLVDGPFVEAQKDLMLRFRGSSNQRLIDVQKSLAAGYVVEWEDWQGTRKGIV